MKIAIIGAGNVACHLAQALASAGHQVKAIYSRTEQNRTALANILPHAHAIDSLNLQELDIDLVIIAVPDKALAIVAVQLQVQPNAIVAHTSGSQPMAALQKVAGARTGVFYPLQTFSKSKPVDFKQVPLLLEAQDMQTLSELEELAQTISEQVQTVDSSTRKQLHIAAVFACNFTNHLLGISRQLLQEASLPPQLLQPLIQETVAKAAQQHPFTVQTGPAARNDSNVIEEHLHMLEQHPGYQLLYKELTKSIQEAQLNE
ncbi:Rossmann-like and DUF2520 domain-containing protein [Pontibacter silvestris]|uniref:Rossmann-like and DUF2520 domain-containing protein n=1 Tax=Pontibacter silvestris TaxID=2305183 RepID=A0ABW4X3Q3_9BACT|nr:Rossmann-like and DUF2520 domain-containing protein [Pontibacter silvestris]MCC9137107.1 DUF2520 domain-containing protein [Pontibacter silvestris]